MSSVAGMRARSDSSPRAVARAARARRAAATRRAPRSEPGTSPVTTSAKSAASVRGLEPQVAPRDEELVRERRVEPPGRRTRGRRASRRRRRRSPTGAPRRGAARGRARASPAPPSAWSAAERSRSPGANGDQRRDAGRPEEERRGELVERDAAPGPRGGAAERRAGERGGERREPARERPGSERRSPKNAAASGARAAAPNRPASTSANAGTEKTGGAGWPAPARPARASRRPAAPPCAGAGAPPAAGARSCILSSVTQSRVLSSGKRIDVADRRPSR